MKFSEIQVGQKFTTNGIEYTKIEPQKVSCCKTLNAINLSDNNKVMIKPDTDVEVVTE
jgi:hypothetical protein